MRRNNVAMGLGFRVWGLGLRVQRLHVQEGRKKRDTCISEGDRPAE